MCTNSILCNNIILALEENNIQNFSLNQISTSSEELFYERKNLVLSRNKDTDKCEVTIYNDFFKDGLKMRGSSSFIADYNMSAEEISNKISTAYKTALSVSNPYYKLPACDSIFTEKDSQTIIPVSNNNIYTAFDIAKIIYDCDTDSNAFINSCEVFVNKKIVNIINSNGINVSYCDTTYFFEYIVQCTKPTDVELYQSLTFSSNDSDIENSIKNKINASLKIVKDRANAISVSSLSKPPVYEKTILEGECIYELFNYYIKRLDASMIYPGYSSFKIGDNIKYNSNEGDCSSENNSDKINITLNPKQPYSNEGIKLAPHTLIKDDIVNCITGNSRFSHYLHIPALGEYESYTLECGSTSSEEMCLVPHLRIVNFSDFQVDTFTGHFGGEYRLAYYFDGKNTIPLTNGSISGNISDLIKTFELSKESQCFYEFSGPYMLSYT